MDSTSAIKEICVTGNSLVLFLTKELRMPELEKGDKVKITLEKVN